jgi:transketolase
VLAICGQHEVIVALEEHSVYGGLGSALAEIATAEAPTWICRIGVQDRFSQCAGSYRYLMEEHRLTPAAVVSQVKAFFAKLPVGNSARLRLPPSAAA